MKIKELEEIIDELQKQEEEKLKKGGHESERKRENTGLWDVQSSDET